MHKINQMEQKIREEYGLEEGWVNARRGYGVRKEAKFRLFYECVRAGFPAAETARRLGVNHTTVLYGIAVYAEDYNLPQLTTMNIDAHRQRSRETSYKNRAKRSAKEKAERRLKKQMRALQVKAEMEKFSAEAIK